MQKNKMQNKKIQVKPTFNLKITLNVKESVYIA